MNRTPLADRFWPKVDTSGDCWVWTAQRDRDGYGRVRPGGTAPYVRAHRAAWFLATGAWPDPELFVCHTCDNPSCVRIDHLFVGTASDNSTDRDTKKRGGNSGRTHCLNGHEFTPENTYQRKGGPGRHCRACDAERHRAYRRGGCPR